MRVLIVTPCTLPVPAVKGGAVQQLIDEIIEVNEQNQLIDLTIVGIEDIEAKKQSHNFTHSSFVFFKEPKIIRAIDHLHDKLSTYFHKGTQRMPKFYLRKLYVIYKLKKLMLSEEFDSVIFENMGFQLNVLKSDPISKKYNGRCWYHVHNDIPLNINVTCLKKTNIMLISDYLRNRLQFICQKDTPKTIVVKNGIDVSKFSRQISIEEKRELKNKLGISDKSDVLIFVGRLIKEKGIEEVIDSYLMLKEKHNITLVIVGSLNFALKRKSSFEERLQRKSSTTGTKIIFTGYVPNHELYKYYQIADIAVLPSTWDEPAGLTMIEAAASGVPVITTDAGGIPEYLSNECAVFVKRDDNIVNNISLAIEELISDKAKRIKMAKIAKKYSFDNFSKEVFYQNFVQAITIGDKHE